MYTQTRDWGSDIRNENLIWFLWILMTFVFGYIKLTLAVCGQELDLGQWLEQKLLCLIKNLLHAIGYFINKQDKLILHLYSVHWEAFPLRLRFGLDLCPFHTMSKTISGFFHWIHINFFQERNLRDQNFWRLNYRELNVYLLNWENKTWQFKAKDLFQEFPCYLAISPSVNCHTRCVENTLGQSPKNFNKTHVEINFRPSFQYTLTCCLIRVKEKTQTIS